MRISEAFDGGVGDREMVANIVEVMVRGATLARERWTKGQEAEEETEKLYGKAASRIDDIANVLESKGLLREAEELDVVSNTLVKTASNSEATVKAPE